MFPHDALNSKKKKPSFRNLFSLGNRFQRNLRKYVANIQYTKYKYNNFLFRGVYLASILYNGDKILLTADDSIPMIAVDEDPSDTDERPITQADINWLMKVRVASK